jgi:hypothetical protein
METSRRSVSEMAEGVTVSHAGACSRARRPSSSATTPAPLAGRRAGSLESRAGPPPAGHEGARCGLGDGRAVRPRRATGGPLWLRAGHGCVRRNAGEGVWRGCQRIRYAGLKPRNETGYRSESPSLVSSTGSSSRHSERRQHGGGEGISRPAFRSSLFRPVSSRVASLEFSDTLFGASRRKGARPAECNSTDESCRLPARGLPFQCIHLLRRRARWAGAGSRAVESMSFPRGCR